MITKMWNILIGRLVLVICFHCCGLSCQTLCHTFITMQGENVTMDCGFETTVDGGNLKWGVVSPGGHVTELGHIVPGNTACGTDSVDCILHNNGSLTLVDVTVDDGDKYRCLRGNEEGYHYFSEFKLTVLSKGANNPPVITIKAESKVKSFTMGSYGVVHIYETPVCEDKEDGTCMVTCYPPSGVIMDKAYDQIYCNCTDSDGNSDSVHLNLDSHADLKDNCWVPIFLSVVLGIGFSVVVFFNIYQEYLKNRNQESTKNGVKKQSNASSMEEGEEASLQMDTEISSLRQRLTEKETESSSKSEEIKRLGEMNQNKDTVISDLRHELTQKEAECRNKSEKISALMEKNKNKDVDMSNMKQKLAEKEAECANKSEKIDDLKQMNKEKDKDVKMLKREVKAVEEKYHEADKKLAVKEEELKNIKKFYPLLSEMEQQKANKELETHLPSSRKQASDEDSDGGKQEKRRKNDDPERRWSTRSGLAVEFPKDETPALTFNKLDGEDNHSTVEVTVDVQ